MTEEIEVLKDIKKLLILQLLNSGVSGTAIAKLLEMDQGNFSRAYPAKELLKKTKQ